MYVECASNVSQISVIWNWNGKNLHSACYIWYSTNSEIKLIETILDSLSPHCDLQFSCYTHNL